MTINVEQGYKEWRIHPIHAYGSPCFGLWCFGFSIHVYCLN